MRSLLNNFLDQPHYKMLKQRHLVLVGLLLTGLLGIQVGGEFYSSIDKMQSLAYVEPELASVTLSYLTEREEQLEDLRSFLHRTKEEHLAARAELEQAGQVYSEDPLQVFRLMKRLVVDWKELHSQLAKNSALEKYQGTMQAVLEMLTLPNEEELQGAVKGLRRLQHVYNVTTSQMAGGVLNGEPTGVILSWNDCFEIGVQFYQLADYYAALEWLEHAYKMLQEFDGRTERMTAEVSEYLVLTHKELGEKEKGVEILNELLPELSPETEVSARFTLDYLDHSVSKCPKVEQEPYWFANFSRLCQGKLEPERTEVPLSCYLEFKRDAIFQLSPLKVEQVHVDPDIHVYHGVLNDNQIEALFKESDDVESFRSSVGGFKITDLRVSQQIWLKYDKPILKTINRLVSTITGFDMGNAEEMQVANYGLGGLYAPHFDFQAKLAPDYIPRGNRIATNMIYLSDVLQGGYTVFPMLNAFVQPVKGSLVVWHNLMRSLQPDRRTLHAGCPVLEGAKRIANIWIRSTGQEFRRPCTLNKKE